MTINQQTQKAFPVPGKNGNKKSPKITFCLYCNVVILILLAFYFFLIPFCTIIYYLADPALKDAQIPKIAINTHRKLTPRYEKWAKNRMTSKKARNLRVEDISGTEWPLFGSVFYLWATESIQNTWNNNNFSTPAPNVYAAGAVKAAAQLVTDPAHATWVKQHWGPDYLHKENVFYRMLLISAMTSCQNLLGGKKYTSFLQDQVNSLSKELDESPYGLLDDYPNQCYPTDVVAAIAAIKRADALLQTDHSDFIKRSVRAFKGNLVDSTGLPPYFADADSGSIGRARGCSSQWITVWAPYLWPEYAIKLYKNYEEHFWQQNWFAAGFREFPKDSADSQWHIDVDSGPVIAGFGTSATAFGLGAARANGRFDHAYPLAAEAVVFSWPLPNGTLAGPRILSNLTHAPYIGEAALLYNITTMPPPDIQITKGSDLPFCIYLVLSLYLIVGLVILFAARFAFKFWKKRISQNPVPLADIQFVLWLFLVLTGLLFLSIGKIYLPLIIILFSQLLPIAKKLKQKTMDNEL